MDVRSTSVGLDGPLTRLRERLAAARARSTCVVVDADAGVGLTTLLQAFVGELGGDVAVHTARGLAWETAVPSAVLQQLAVHVTPGQLLQNRGGDRGSAAAGRA